MNIIDIQDNLKDFSEQQLIKEIQMPSGMAPQFLVLSEINRRKRMRDDYAKSQAVNQMTVAEEAIAAGGVPQTGIRGMSEAMAPQSSMAQSGIGTVMNQAMKPSPMPQREMSEAEVMGMAEGGVVRMQNGGDLPLGLRYNNPGNIRPGAGFYGETGEGDGYARFGSEEEGLRAMARLLGTYSDKYGINTVEDLVGRYAPRSDNPESFDNYVGYMSDALGVEPDEAFDLIGRRDEIIPAMVGFEQGREYSTRYKPDLISRAITAASYDDPEAIKTAMSGDVEPDGITSDSILNALLGIGSAQASTQQPPANTQTTQTQPEDKDESSLDAVGIPPLWQDNWSTKESDYNQYVKDAQKAGQEIVNPWEYEEVQRRLVGREDDYLDVIDEDLVGTEFEQYIGNPNAAENLAAGSARAATEGSSPFDIADPQTGSRGDDAASIAEELAGDLEITSPEDAETVGQGVAESINVLPSDAPPEQIIAETKKNILTSDDATSDDAEETSSSASKTLADQLDFVLSQEATGLAKDISELQEELKAGRETDKWLALAQAGMALMSSREPTLMGALGEAGLSGLGAQREANQRYREGVIDLINARAKLAESPLEQSDAIEMYTEITNALNEKDDISGDFTINDPAERKNLEILRSRIAGSLPSGSTLSLLSME